MDSWVKCEFISSVSEHRLDRMRRNGAQFAPRLSDADLKTILRATMYAIGSAELLFRP